MPGQAAPQEVGFQQAEHVFEATSNKTAKCTQCCARLVGAAFCGIAVGERLRSSDHFGVCVERLPLASIAQLVRA